ncbi:MAG: carboxypeptidase regulatory-like domain-containing protein [Gemmatimonadota bacterium]|nr:carboxypeptidase regulatory-like domain-containing protein [Gemmatimonadota bacterium]
MSSSSSKVVGRGGIVALALLVGAAAVGAQTQGALIGSVVDEESGEPIEGATVVLSDSRSGVLTEEDGRFSIEGVSEGDVTVRIERDGYSTLVETLEVLPGEVSVVRFELLPVTAVLEGLRVTGDADREQGHVESDVSGRDDASGTAVDLLEQQVPGLTVSRTDGDVGSGARVRLRGVSSLTLPNDPAIYLNGVRIDEGGAAGAIDALNQIPAASVTRIRILRGSVATTRYPLAAAGVILIETGSRDGGGS